MNFERNDNNNSDNNINNNKFDNFLKNFKYMHCAVSELVLSL